MIHTPVRGRTTQVSAPMRVLHRFTKPGGHWAEIRERKVSQWQALEFLVYVNGHMQESWMFHGARLDDYPGELAKRRAWFVEDGWTEDVSLGGPPTF